MIGDLSRKCFTEPIKKLLYSVIQSSNSIVEILFQLILSEADFPKTRYYPRSMKYSIETSMPCGTRWTKRNQNDHQLEELTERHQNQSTFPTFLTDDEIRQLNKLIQCNCNHQFEWSQIPTILQHTCSSFFPFKTVWREMHLCTSFIKHLGATWPFSFSVSIAYSPHFLNRVHSSHSVYLEQVKGFRIRGLPLLLKNGRILLIGSC